MSGKVYVSLSFFLFVRRILLRMLTHLQAILEWVFRTAIRLVYELYRLPTEASIFAAESQAVKEALIYANTTTDYQTLIIW